jgi:serine/threonine protein phosphatase PrpC
MIFNSDSYFSIGSTHKRCEDYSLCGLKSYGAENDASWALISDGCSGSPNTHVGSLLISICAEIRLKYHLSEESSFRSRLLSAIDIQRENLELNKECLDATLLFVQSTKNQYEVRAYGDGSILKLRNDGIIELTLIEYPSGAPLYLNYYLDDIRFEMYKSQYGLQRKIFKYIIGKDSETFTVTSDETGLPYIEEGIIDDYKAIVVTSDGITSFAKYVNKQPEYIDSVFIARHIMDFKSIKGKFIERRINAFKDYCEKNLIKHTDDFSMAGISYER